MWLSEAGKQIPREKIQKMIDLLDKKVTDIEFFVHIYEDVTRATEFLSSLDMENKEDFLKQLEEGLTFGGYCDLIQRVMIYNFNILKNPLPELNFVFTLYHEIRHAYQDYYLSDKMKREKENAILYGETWAEMDANYWAAQWILQHKKSIVEIIGYDFSNDYFYRFIHNYNEYMKIEV